VQAGRTLKYGFTVLLGVAGCAAPPRKVVSHPPGTLRVVYEQSTVHSSCLVASAVMAANYLLDRRVLTEEGVRQELAARGRDETRVADIRAFLAEQGLHLVVLQGRLDGEPPAGLEYWLKNRGYPVICVINRQPGDPAFNHAVVVIGISSNPQKPGVDIIHYLDPSSAEPLHSVERPVFQILWGAGDCAMMVVVRPPEPGPGVAGGG